MRLKVGQVKETREQFLQKQANLCPICNKHIHDPVLDHDHKTGLIRAVLHRSCNLYLGKIENSASRNGVQRDDISAVLRGIADYLDEHIIDQTGLLHPTYLTEEEKIIKRNKKARKRYKKSKENKVKPVLTK